MGHSPRVVIDPVRVGGLLARILSTNHAPRSCVPLGVADVSRTGLGYCTPAPVRYARPSVCSVYRTWKPDGTVVAKIVSKIDTASRFDHNRRVDMCVKVSQIDDVRAAAEGAEGRCTGGDLA